MWFFAIVYAVEGTCQARAGVMVQPLTYWLKESIHWDPVTISASLSILDLPWIIKPLWGAISDFVPLFGYRRRPYLVLANLAACVAFAWVAMIDTTAALIPALVLSATAMAISSTLSGALLVEIGQKTNNSANYVNQQWLWYNIAQMIALVVAGYLIEILSPIGAMHTAAVIAAIAPLSVLPGVLLISEARAPIDLEAFRGTFPRLGESIPQSQPMVRRRFSVPILFQSGFRHPAVFPNDRPAAFLPGADRRSVRGQRGWLDHRRPAVSLAVETPGSAGHAAAEHYRRHSQHPCLSTAQRPGHCRGNLTAGRHYQHDRDGRHHVAGGRVRAPRAPRALPSPR